MYHQLVLPRAEHAPLHRIVSEGEARCLAIAAFFAELSTADDASALLFDDPVSSLDHRFRERVAQRLVQEAKTRQVIVFTHDLVFLLALKDAAKDQVPYTYQSVLRIGESTGVCHTDLPWDALDVKRRIGFLRAELQETKGNATTNPLRWRKDATYLYGLLRESWERAVEEVLLAGVVERYRKSIETTRGKVLHDITTEDLDILEANMTKTSRWLPGHDKAPAENIPTPGPNELKTDIDVLDSWVKTIRVRRQKK